jgi:hypothetical protein
MTVTTSSTSTWLAVAFVAGSCFFGYSVSKLIGKIIFASLSPKASSFEALDVLRGLKEHEILYMFKRQTITKQRAFFFVTIYSNL